jgi:hypothetical protein
MSGADGARSTLSTAARTSCGSPGFDFPRSGVRDSPARFIRFWFDTAEAARRVRVHDLGSEPVTTFLVIGVAGLVLLAASLVVGDLLDGALDVLPGDAFSSAVIAAFVSAFGFGAAAAESLGVGRAVAVASGMAAGVTFAWFAAWLTRLVRGSGSEPPPSTGDTVGHEGRVVTGIPAEGFGVVHVHVGGH